MARKNSIPVDPNAHIDADDRKPTPDGDKGMPVKEDLPVEEDEKHDAKFGEPIAAEYPDGAEAEVSAGAQAVRDRCRASAGTDRQQPEPAWHPR